MGIMKGASDVTYGRAAFDADFQPRGEDVVSVSVTVAVFSGRHIHTSSRRGLTHTTVLSSARERLQRVKLVRKDKAAQIEGMLVQMATSGKLPGKVTETQLIQVRRGGRWRGGRGAFALISLWT